MLHGQPSLPYFTQTAYPDNRHIPDCMLYCVGRLAVATPNSLRCGRVIRPCARVSLLFNSRVPKTLERSRSLKFTVRVMSRICFKSIVICCRITLCVSGCAVLTVWTRNVSLDYFTVLTISLDFSLIANSLKLFLLVIKLLILFYIYGGAFGFST